MPRCHWQIANARRHLLISCFLRHSMQAGFQGHSISLDLSSLLNEHQSSTKPPSRLQHPHHRRPCFLGSHRAYGKHPRRFFASCLGFLFCRNYKLAGNTTMPDGLLDYWRYLDRSKARQKSLIDRQSLVKNLR